MMEVKNIKQKNEEISDFIHLVASNTDAAKVKENSIKSNPFWIARNINLWQRRPVQWSIKRIFDLIASTLGIIMISPILALIAIAIKLDSKGPVFFKQKRVGLYGREFYMYKFRSMVQDAEKEIEAMKCFNETNDVMFKMYEDPRITKIGKIIRKYSLDELPQLFNVIRGEMSLVGPRPPLMSEVENYNAWHYLKFATLPGLTGMWQVNGRAKIKNFDTVVKLDYSYIDKWNLKLDFYLLFKTIPVVILAKGAA